MCGPGDAGEERVRSRPDSLNYGHGAIPTTDRNEEWDAPAFGSNSMSRSKPTCMVAFGARHARRVAAFALAGTVCSAPLSAAAVGLGAITQQSALGQSLRVVVPVTLGDNEEIPAECFKIAAGTGAADGVPELLFGRVNVERSASGTTLVVTSSRPVQDPVVRLTIQAGCETSVRREYTLLMDPPAIETPVVATQLSPREVLGLPPPAPAATPTPGRRAAKPPVQPRTPASATARSARAPADAAAQDKAAGAKARVAPRTTPRPPPPAATAARPRLSVSSGAPGTLPGSLATEADRERARQERANQIEAETAVLRQRIVELTAMVERMQAELRAQEAAEQAAAAQAAKAAAAAAKAPADAGKAPADNTAAAADVAQAAAVPAPTDAPASAPSWWEQNALLLAAIVGLPLLIAAGLLWKRRRDASQDELWRTHTASIRRDTLSRASQLRNTAAGLAAPDRRTISPAMSREMDPAPPREAVDALAVSELSHVTEEARVFMALGHNDRAIEALQDHIRRLPRSMPAAWLMLLDLYHRQGDRSEFRKLGDAFHAHFNVRAPQWEEFAAGSPTTGGLEMFPAIEQQVVALWRKPNCRAYLEGLLYDNREGRRNGFPLATYADVLLLLQVLDAPEDVDIDGDLVAAGKLEGRPKAKAAADVARRPMPPEPAPRPVQQPIRFELEPPQDPAEKARR